MQEELSVAADLRPVPAKPLVWIPVLLVLCLTMFSSRSDSLFRTQNLELVALALVWLLCLGEMRFPRAALRGPAWLLAILAVGLASAAWGIWMGDSLISTRTLLKQVRDPFIGVAAYVTLVGVSHRLSWQQLLRWTVVTFVCSTALVVLATYIPAMAGFAAWVQHYEGRGITAGFEGPNSLGAAVSLLFPWGLACLFEARTVRSRLGFGLTTGLSLFFLVLTESRGAFLTTLLGLLLMLGMLLVTRGARRRWPALLLLVGIAVGGAISLGETGLVDRVLQTNWSALEQDLTTQRRVLLLRAATGLFVERPILGHGLGGFEAEVERYLGASMESSTTPHNTVLFVAAQCGVAGLAMLLGFYLWVWRSSLRFFQCHRDHWGAAAIASTMVALMNELFFPYSLTHDTGLLLWMLLAVMVGGYWERRRVTTGV